MGVKAARPTLRLLMSVATLATTVTESAGSLGKKPKKSPDRDALMLFGQALQFQGWHENSGWGSGDSVCKWHGITCNDHTRVTGIDLGENGLDGFIHPAIGNLTELKTLNVKGGRPAGYYGCNDSNVHYTGIPDTFYNLVKLTDIDAEYMCLGGPISPLIGNLVNLVSIQIHGNFLNGTIPLEFNKLTELQVFKLGRNPLSGPFPNLSQCKKLVKFNCNFCSLTGAIPDIFDNFPDLEQSYWDGNGLTGALPPSLAKAKKLTTMSFNINQLSGKIPEGLCDLPLDDCRIGNDTNLTSYLANYPWIQNVTGNVYDCPVPSCAQRGGKCFNVKDCTDVVDPCSPVVCKR